MSVLCFGGSFNPIHYGHLRTSEAVARKLSYDQILLIPSAHPPHKPLAADLAAPADRFRMCQLAIRGSDIFQVSDIELHRAGPSYTIDTTRQLRSGGIKNINWLIGADMLRILPSWHEAHNLLREVNFVIIARPGWTFDWQTLPAEFRILKEHVVEAPLVEISATEIRRRVRAGIGIDDLTPPLVAQYIEEHGLYRDPVSA